MAQFSRHPNTRKKTGKPDPEETKLEYRSHVSRERDQSKSLILVIIFHDRAHPHHPREYNYPAMVNAIEDRKRQGLETEDLEKWKAWAEKQYSDRGLMPPETRKQKRRRLQSFVNG